MNSDALHHPLPVPVDRALIRDIVDTGINRYIAERRARVHPFIDRNYALKGAVELHRRAIGLDILRTPANLILAVPHLMTRIGADGLRRAGAKEWAAKLEKRRLYFESDVAKEVTWRLYSELLELPYEQDDRRFERDALTETILADPRLLEALKPLLAEIGHKAEDPEFRAWLTEAMATYTGSRVAAADMATALLSLGLGVAAFREVTPGMITLGPMVAQAIMQKVALSSFPLGATVGAAWYSLFPVATSTAFVVGTTATLMAGAAVFAAVSGVVTDPLQRRLGLHERRLNRMIDALERRLGGETEARFVVRDHYVARMLDLVDWLRAAYRFTH